MFKNIFEFVKAYGWIFFQDYNNTRYIYAFLLYKYYIYIDNYVISVKTKPIYS